MYVKPLYIDFREAVESCFGLNNGETRNCIYTIVNKVSLFRHASVGIDISLYRLISAQCGLYDRLCRYI